VNLFELDILILLGLGTFGGVVGARLFQQWRIPQVVGYIAIGVLIGKSGFGLIDAGTIRSLSSFNLFALGLIGFLVGGELHGDTFRRYGRQFCSILLGEGLGAFFLVGIPVTLICLHFLGSFPSALAAGIVFGAIASATDPASTVDVLWEYRSRGILTTSLVAIVALDDALAMTLYGLGTTAAAILAGESTSLGQAAAAIGIELFGAVALGAAMGILVNYLLRWLRRKEQTLVTALAVLLLVIGGASATGMDVILAAMTLGVTLTNLAPRRSEELFSLVTIFSRPIYVIFFVLVGAGLGIGQMPAWFWSIILVYVLARSLGKFFGARLGARLAGAPEPVARYAGFGLFAQGGVAVGLSIMAAHHLDEVIIDDNLSLGEMIVSAITATTLIVQVIGPPMVKFAIRRAGEIGRNITEEDVIAEWTTKQVMDSSAPIITEGDSLTSLVREFTTQATSSFPVADSRGRIIGIVTLEGLKEVMSEQGCWEWILAGDVMIPVTEMVTGETPLSEALDLMRQLNFERLAVVNDLRERQAIGILDNSQARKLVAREVLRRQAAEGPEAAEGAAT